MDVARRGGGPRRLAGGGWSVLPAYLCAADLAAGRLVRLHEPVIAPLNTLYLAERAGEPSPARERLVSELRRAVRSSPRPSR